MAAVVTDRDKGYKDLVARVFSVAERRQVVEVGILEGKGAEPHGEDAATTIIEVAIWNEFGTSRTVTKKDGTQVVVSTPSRSFIRAWFDEEESAIREQLVRLMQDVLRGRRKKEQILEQLAQWCVGRIQQRIAEGTPPPNAPSTVKRKGSSTPLIDKGILRSSISYRVTEER